MGCRSQRRPRPDKPGVRARQRHPRQRFGRSCKATASATPGRRWQSVAPRIASAFAIASPLAHYLISGGPPTLCSLRPVWQCSSTGASGTAARSTSPRLGPTPRTGDRRSNAIKPGTLSLPLRLAQRAGRRYASGSTSAHRLPRSGSPPPSVKQWREGEGEPSQRSEPTLARGGCSPSAKPRSAAASRRLVCDASPQEEP
jgi:hypothetical protein